MKRHMFVLLLLACAGCAPVVTIKVTDIAKSDSLEVRDARPVTEKEGNAFSLLITSKQYGILRAGDAKLSPMPVRLLQHEAFQKFSAEDHLPKVTVYHFAIYENIQSQSRSDAFGVAIGGLIGGAISRAAASHHGSSQTSVIDETAFNSLSDEYLRGRYTAAENPKKSSVYIIYVDTEVDGRKVFTRTIAPHGDTNALAYAVQLAIKDHLAQYDVGATVTTRPAPDAQAANVGPSPTPVATTDSTPEAPQIAPANTPTTVDSAAEEPQVQTASDNTPTMSVAQNIASQLGCGVVKADGSSGFVAPCGSYEVAIDCDGERCHPTHTVSMKSPE
jgi:hypothetical protein